jgi:hypothetical protein
LAPAEIDLHLHSDFSDGDLPVEELLALCGRLGIRLAAVTDHDEIRSAEVPSRHGVALISGVEVTARWHGREVHCLGYLYQPGDRHLKARVSGYRRALLECWREIFDRAASFGCRAGWSEIEAAVGVDRVPYPGRMLEMLLAGVEERSPLAAARGLRYERIVADWFAGGRPLHVEEPAPPQLRAVIGWLREAGGVPVLAHPLVQLDYGELDRDVPALRDAGLGGLEAWSTWHRPGSDEALVALCRRHRMVATAGSDFHGVAVKPWVPRPGAVAGAPPPPDAMAEALCRERSR